MYNLSIKRNLSSSRERGMGLPVNHVVQKLPFPTSLPPSHPAPSPPKAPSYLRWSVCLFISRLAHIWLFLTAKRTDRNSFNWFLPLGVFIFVRGFLVFGRSGFWGVFFFFFF